MNSYDIVEDAVRLFWCEVGYAHTVIAFFYQKYSFETEWEYCAELVMSDSTYMSATVEFENDFCEGQTDVKDIHIVSLDDIAEFYYNHVIANRNN